MESLSTPTPRLTALPVAAIATIDPPAAPFGRANLPPQPTRLVGRAAEVQLVHALLHRADVRLLTLTGPGGVGKTRLALAAATAAHDIFPDGAWFVDLAPLADPALVVPTIARTLAVREVPRQGPDEAVVARLCGRSALLVLDNCEHLLAAAAAIDGLLVACPGLTVLATSREPLRLRREHVVEVPPLPVPDRQETTWPIAELAAVPGVALFVERARAADASFVLTKDNAAAVAELCRRLDGLPLALELAAARTRLLDPAALVARVDHVLGLLRWDAPDLPPRQRTMQATLDWSHALLTADEQAMFRRLAVFAGGFSLDAAEWVAGSGWRVAGTEPSSLATPDPRPETFDVIAALVDKHLVRALGREEGELRFGLLGTVREYALAQLEASGETAAARELHLANYLALAERADQAMRGQSETPWVSRLEVEHANLRAALDWAIVTANSPAEWRLVTALQPLWITRGHLREGLERVEAALSRPYEAEPGLLARVLETAGMLAEWLGDQPRAATWFERGLVAAREAGDPALAAWLLGGLSRLAYVQGDADRARALVAEMLALARTVDARREIGKAFLHLVVFAIGPAGHPRERERLRAELDEPVALLREAGDRRGLALLLAGRARLLADEADATSALAPLRESLELAQGLDDQVLTHFVPWVATVLLAERLPAERAARLVGGVEALVARIEERGSRTLIDLSSAPRDHDALERATTAARGALGEAAFAAAAAAGRTLSFEQVVAEALAALTEVEAAVGGPAPHRERHPEGHPGDTRPDRAGRENGLLSPREREVLALVAEGRSNKAIAAALFVSPNTVKTHVASLLNKLEADTRAHLAAIAAERGLL